MDFKHPMTLVNVRLHPYPRHLEKKRQVSGFDQSAFDNTAPHGLNDEAFEDSEEDSGAIVEEFLPAVEDQPSPIEPQGQRAAPAKSSLAQKLESRATRHNSKPTTQ
jgi:hypothetical protein